MNTPSSISTSKRGENDILEINNDFAKATISLFGGHILSYIPKTDNIDRLWVSDAAIFDNKTAIRGGIPVCWPWFGDGHKQNRDDLPAHGFVRNQIWSLDSAEENDQGTQLVLTPKSTQGPGWAFKTTLKLKVTVGKTLVLELITRNMDAEDIHLGCALHTYFSVDDIDGVTLAGLSGPYLDKTQNYEQFETPETYRIKEETDRVHLHPAVLVEINNGHHISVRSTGHDSIVVWNPWKDNCLRMKDMQPDSYETMICVETAITQGKILKSKEEVIIKQQII
ncbi:MULTISPECIES: D-hexose-6-phosphate mutarotase [Alteromonadaceae]|uniref:D-hexose-6-phosphate mutarotase n=1 Tax=Alteromonadaceae TaxID=72275 RepID=UPI001C0A1F0B|nr:D-hexose-6-phosphate mutarotase [Aliiglaciecola lipolytica]MBU2876160.1 D-hexose-6-phosphate mutarotase [Aliiglaciecola lipolytica]